MREINIGIVQKIVGEIKGRPTIEIKNNSKIMKPFTLQEEEIPEEIPDEEGEIPEEEEELE